MFELMQAIRIDVESGRAEGRALVEADWPALADHFPGVPLLPGSLLIELAAQVAGPLAEEFIRRRHGIDRWALLGMVRNARFTRASLLPVTLDISAQLVRSEPSTAVVSVAARSDQGDVLRGELMMMMVTTEPDWAEAIRARDERVARWKEAF